MIMHRATGWFVAAFVAAFVARLTVPGAVAIAQVGKLIDPNAAAESEIAQLPGMTPAVVKSMVERRPFKTVIELNRFLLDQKLMPEQVKAFYGKAFVPINLNTGTREEFMLIPGVGSRMSAEFME